MKKLYSLLMLSAAVVSAFGQARISGTVNANTPSGHAIIKSGNPATMMLPDTLWPPSFGLPFQCDTAAVYYNWTPATDGYVFGNNTYSATACAQKYYGTGNVDEVIAWIAYKTGTTGTTSAKIYSIDPVTKKPSATVLGTSAVVTLANVVTTPFTSYTFAPTVAVTNEFAVSVEFPTTQSAGDTVAVVSTTIGCATTDSLSWMKLPVAYGGWRSTPSVIQGNPNCELYIFPVGTFNPIGVNEYSANGLTLMGAYPNPAKDFTNISYTIKEQATVSVNVFDLTGRVILNSSQPLSAGNHNIKVPLKDIPDGNYYYTITTGDARLTSKFVVAK